jgi:hypothetical protein
MSLGLKYLKSENIEITSPLKKNKKSGGDALETAGHEAAG